MTWIAVTQDQTSAFERGAPTGLRVSRRAMARSDDLTRGSLYLEADLQRWKHDDQALFVFHSNDPVHSHCAMHLGADATLTFSRRLDGESRQVCMPINGAMIDGTLRVTVSWDCARGTGLISAELPDEGVLVQREMIAPLPWTQGDLHRLKTPRATFAFGPSLRCFGLSDGVEPVGLSPSLTDGTPILTPNGYVPIETLSAGDLVQTEQGPRAICWITQREVLARGRFRPIRLLAPYLGLKQDIILSPEQRIKISGTEVEYLFNEEAVLVPAQTFLHSNFATWHPAPAVIRYHQLVLEDHGVIDVAGCPMDTMFIGDLREQSEVMSTTVLAEASASQIPVHHAMAYPALCNFEAITLRAALLCR
jgi:hypothetical protein